MQEESLRGRLAAGGPPGIDANSSVNFSLVMVVASTAVNRIVVSRIVERAGLKAVACEAGAVPVTLRDSMPCVVVVEEDAGEAGQPTLHRIVETRTRSAAGLPLVIALARPGSTIPDHAAADEVVAMPFTPDSLAPVILRLVEKARTLNAS